VTLEQPIYIHEYLLRSGVALNSASHRRVFPGALLRVGSGYGCVHPWPEFGDAPIHEQLSLLAQGKTTPVTAMALHCASIDGTAREADISLFQDLDIPRSHYSWSFAQDTRPQFEKVLAEGWPAIKAKGYANYGETTRFLENCARMSDDPRLLFRVDFNACLTPDDFHKFIEFMPVRVYRQLDFVEDPFPYDPALWSASRDKWGVKLALDKGWRNGTTGFDSVVVKPARRDWRTVAERHSDKPLVLTSAMDHGLGQMYAAYQAALARKEHGHRIGLCGLSTQHLFDADPFFERIRVTGGHMTPDLTGGGLGFGDVLEKLPWRPLT
jgi:O-succinylbenzoate synthase